MYGCELHHKKGWAPINWCFWSVVLEKTLESPLDCKEIWPVHPKGNQSWKFIGRTNAETEAPILDHLMRRAESLGKTLMLGKIESRRIEEDNRRQDGWMASPAQCTWVWANSGWWWQTGKPGVLQSMEWQRVRHNWATEQKQRHKKSFSAIRDHFCRRQNLNGAQCNEHGRCVALGRHQAYYRQQQMICTNWLYPSAPHHVNHTNTTLFLVISLPSL